MPLESYEYRDPSALISDVQSRRPLHAGDVVLVLVASPSNRQRIVLMDHLPDAALIPHYMSIRQLLAEHVQRMPIPDAPRPPRHSVMTVVARHGLTVFGPNEASWLLGWRYSNHLANAFSGDLILVTEHGWRDFMTGSGGHHPRIAA